MSKAKVPKVFEKQIAKTSQGLRYLEHLEVNGTKLRIDIHSDSYRQQCYCRLNAFNKDSLTWNLIADRPYGAMATKEGLCYRSCEGTPSDFAADRKWLLNLFCDLTDAPHLA